MQRVYSTSTICDLKSNRIPAIKLFISNYSDVPFACPEGFTWAAIANLEKWRIDVSGHDSYILFTASYYRIKQDDSTFATNGKCNTNPVPNQPGGYDTSRYSFTIYNFASISATAGTSPHTIQPLHKNFSHLPGLEIIAGRNPEFISGEILKKSYIQFPAQPSFLSSLLLENSGTREIYSSAFDRNK